MITMPHAQRQQRQPDRERLVLTLFREHGWRSSRPASAGPFAPDFLVKKRGLAYAVAVKAVSESRRDRMLPLLAQAIVQAEAYARDHAGRAAPLAVVVGGNIRESLVKQLEEFARECAPGVAVGIIDEVRGLRRFHGRGLEQLEQLSAESRRSQRPPIGPLQPAVHLFSDLNQWMLKVLLARRIPEDLLSAPRRDYRNPLELAQAAQVSNVSAYRLVRQLRAEGFLDDGGQLLRLVRVENLLQRWRAASLAPAKEVGMRWVLRGDPQQKLREALSAARGQACLGLFAAADALGFGFVRGVPPHLLVRSVDHELLRAMGVSSELATRVPDLFVRVPAAPESTMRGAVVRGDIVAADVLQIWLDTSASASRGEEQADLVWQRVLQPALRGDVRQS